LSFFLTATLVSFYTLGYRYSFDRGIFIYTGSIAIQANPASVTVVVDHNPYAGTITQLNDSYHIAGLNPGEHTIEVSADGYNTWTKKCIVNSGISTEFWNVLLVKNTYPTTDYDTAPISKAFPSPKSTLLAFVSSTDNGFSVNALDTKTGTPTPVFTADDATFDTNDTENIEWSIDADIVSIPAIKDHKKTYFIVNVNTQSVINLTEFTRLDNLRAVRWDSSRDNVLFALSDSTLFEINLDDVQNKITVAKNIDGYDISGNDLYILENAPGNIVYKTNLSNLDTRIQITSLPSEATDNRFSIIAYDEYRIALINYFTGDLFVYNKNEDALNTFSINGNVKGVQFSDDGKKLLYWTHHEMFVYYTRKWETQPRQNANTTITAGRLSQSINNIHWEKDYEHITFSVGSTIKVIELDTRGEKSIVDVMHLSSAPVQIINNFAESMLFYTLAKNNDLHASSIHSINFPEKIQGIFTTR
jgi:hypothetical protein